MNKTTDMSALPIGLRFALSQNASAMNAFESLSDQSRKDMIMRARQAGSKEEMRRLIQTLG